MKRCKWIWEIQGKSYQQVMATDWMCDGEGEKFEEGSKVSSLNRWLKLDCHSLKYEIFVSKKEGEADRLCRT